MGLFLYENEVCTCIILLQTANEFNRQYKMRLNTPAVLENNYTFTFVAPLAYDAVWSLALALNATDGMLNWPKERIIKRTSCQDDGTELTGFRLDDFTYNNSFVGCVIRWNLAQTNFVGVSVSDLHQLIKCSYYTVRYFYFRVESTLLIMALDSYLRLHCCNTRRHAMVHQFLQKLLLISIV